MMAYLRAYIEQCEALGFAGGPEFKTTIVAMTNGRERRNADWDQPRHRFTLPFQNIAPRAYAQIKQMHMVCRGALNAFLYRDPLDNVAVDQLFAVGDGVETVFQLSTLSVVDGVSYLRNVYALDTNADVAISINGSVADPSAYTLDRDRGKVAFASAPANGAILRWSGDFVVWVRFANDWLPFSIDQRRAGEYAINGSVELVEVKPPMEVVS